MPVELLTLPDEQDPADREFSSGNGFSHHDRCYLMVLNYAGSLLHPGKHGPQMDTEWWVGREGLRWEQPGRDVNALGNSFPGNARITHNPMIIGGQLLFHFGNHLVDMKQDRISPPQMDLFGQGRPSSILRFWRASGHGGNCALPPLDSLTASPGLTVRKMRLPAPYHCSRMR